MRRLLLTLAAALVATAAWSQELAPLDKTPIYRRSFTARYELIGGEAVREAAMSPDGRLAGFVRAGDLFVKEIATGRTTRITHDGERGKIINGATDWVYEEEYGFTRAYQFSPDSRRVAYLRFDESRVPEFSMMRYDEKLYPEVYSFKYPKAGEENSLVTLHVYDLATGDATEVMKTPLKLDPIGPAAGDYYIPRIGWTPSGELFFYYVNRLQNRFEVVLADVDDADGKKPDGAVVYGRTIYLETSPTYVERPDESTVTFGSDGDSFTVKNETASGWWQSHLYSIENGFERVLSTDEAAPDIDKWNGRITDGRKFFSFTTDEGVLLYGWMIAPAGFDPERAEKYPVFMTQYSGPGSRSVFVEKVGDMSIYGPLLEAGYIVACIDPRGTGGRGEAFKKCTYGQLGKLETQDQIAAARWLGSLPCVDASRIGIYGWSYGGFISLNSILKGADVFKAAVAVAPVTSWRFYDTIYTEIYNGLPADNPAGYDENSPINYAGLLRGKLLLVHGTGDDNVHIQNTYEMARALVEADRPFDMMTYTDDNHSMYPSGGRHVREKIVDWVKENL